MRGYPPVFRLIYCSLNADAISAVGQRGNDGWRERDETSKRGGGKPKREGERRREKAETTHEDEKEEKEEEKEEEDAYVRVTERNAERHKLSGQRAH